MSQAHTRTLPNPSERSKQTCPVGLSVLLFPSDACSDLTVSDAFTRPLRHQERCSLNLRALEQKINTRKG